MAGERLTPNSELSNCPECGYELDLPPPSVRLAREALGREMATTKPKRYVTATTGSDRGPDSSRYRVLAGPIRPVDLLGRDKGEKIDFARKDRQKPKSGS